MNRRIVGLFVVFFGVLLCGVMSNKQLFAADKAENAQSRQKRYVVKDNVTRQADTAAQAAQNEGDIAVDEFDIQQKQKEVRSLLDRGVSYCGKNDLVKVCHAFTHTKDFTEGELYLFLMDTKGVIYAHGEQSNLLWKSLWDYRDNFGAFAIQSIIKTAQNAPGWLTYEWSGAVKVSFVQKVTIDDKEYVIGCGYYPHSKKYAVIGLVKGAVALFNNDMAAGRPLESPFSSMGYSKSDKFIYGDLYLYALDFDGVIWAQGDDANLIGRNSLNRADARGRTINKEIIDKLKLKEEGEGIWVEYTSKNALKLTYAEKVKDTKGKFYFIACGYYPETDRDLTIDLVRRAYQFMKASGTSVASKEFSDKAINTYNLGDLYIFVYDLKGNCIAHGSNPALAGQNLMDERDEDGRYYVREIIEQAKSGGGWLDFKMKNSFEAVYVEQIDMGVDTYVIGSSLFPVSKPETMTLLVKSAIGFLQSHTEDELFRKLTDRKDNFIRGDLYLSVCDLDGYCYAWGDEQDFIWKNLLEWKSEDGKLFIKDMIEASMKGPDHFVYKFNKRMRINYVEQVEKNGKKYIISSGFYR